MTKDDRTKTGGPAFPSVFEMHNAKFFEQGATLRDLFAAQVLTNPAIASADESTANIAGAAYAIADAMIAARKTEAE